MLHPNVLGELLLELDRLPTQNVLPMIEHALNARVHGLANALVLGLEVDELHGKGIVRTVSRG